MSCRDTIRLVCEYLEGVLEPGVTGEVEDHFEHCASCRILLDAAQKTLVNDFDGQLPHAAQVSHAA